MIKYETNSKLISEGQIFVAIVGNTVDGHDYIEDAIKKGVEEIICEKGKYSVKTTKVRNTRKYLVRYLKDNVVYDLEGNIIYEGDESFPVTMIEYVEEDFLITVKDMKDNTLIPIWI